MPTIHPVDAKLINLMLGVALPPKEIEQEYFARRRMLELTGWPHDSDLGPITLVDMLRSLGFDPPEESPPCVPWNRYPQDGSIRVEARWRIANHYEWLSGVFLGFVGYGYLSVKLDSEPVSRAFLESDVRLAANQRRQCDTVSPQTDSIDASDAPRDMEVPDIGPDDPTVLSISPPAHEEFDWCMVSAGQDVFVQDGDVEIVGSMMAVAGNEILLQIQGEPAPRWFNADACALERD